MLFYNYMKDLCNAHTISLTNAVLKEAANDDRLSNKEYERLYNTALERVWAWRGEIIE